MFVEAIWELFWKEMPIRLILAIRCTLTVALDICRRAPATMSGCGSVGHGDREVVCRSRLALRTTESCFGRRGPKYCCSPTWGRDEHDSPTRDEKTWAKISGSFDASADMTREIICDKKENGRMYKQHVGDEEHFVKLTSKVLLS